MVFFFFAVGAKDSSENQIDNRTSSSSLRAATNATHFTQAIGYQTHQTLVRPWNYSSHVAPVKVTGIYAFKKPRGFESPDHATSPRHRKSSLRKMTRRFRLNFKPSAQSHHSPTHSHLRVSSRMSGKFVGDFSNSSTAKFNISEELNHNMVIGQKSFNLLPRNIRPLENHGLKSNDNNKYRNNLMVNEFLNNNRDYLHQKSTLDSKSFNITTNNVDLSKISPKLHFDPKHPGEPLQQAEAWQRNSDLQEPSNSKSRRSLESSARNVSPSGLEWRVEPPLETRFSNSTGGALHCGGLNERGPAIPSTISWNYEDGRPVQEVRRWEERVRR